MEMKKNRENNPSNYYISVQIEIFLESMRIFPPLTVSNYITLV